MIETKSKYKVGDVLYKFSNYDIGRPISKIKPHAYVIKRISSRWYEAEYRENDYEIFFYDLKEVARNGERLYDKSEDFIEYEGFRLNKEDARAAIIKSLKKSIEEHKKQIDNLNSYITKLTQVSLD